MKRLLSCLLVMVMLSGCLGVTAFADGTGEKISPAVRALIDANTDGGVVVEIFFHHPEYPIDDVGQDTAAVVENNQKAHALLIEQIGEITYMEPDGFSIGRCYIGLPYASIEAVAALETVDYIDLPHDEGSTVPLRDKYHVTLTQAMHSYRPDDEVRIMVKLAYTEHFYVGVAEPVLSVPDGLSTEERNEYILNVLSPARREYEAAYDKARNAYCSAKNQEYAAVIAANADVTVIRISESNDPFVFLETKLSEIEKIASLKIVNNLLFSRVVRTPHDRTYLYHDKFEHQYMYTNYENYDELYATEDWGLVYAEFNSFEDWEVIGQLRLCDRILSWYAPGAAFYPYGYFVYNAAEDTFYPIDRFVNPVYGLAKNEDGKYVKVIVEPTLSLDDYPGLPAALELCKIGRPVGDADFDGDLTIADATRIQRVVAELSDVDDLSDSYPISEGSDGLHGRYSDADGDGSITVMDATRIQRAIAELCSIDGGEYTQPVIKENLLEMTAED